MYVLALGKKKLCTSEESLICLQSVLKQNTFYLTRIKENKMDVHSPHPSTFISTLIHQIAYLTTYFLFQNPLIFFSTFYSEKVRYNKRENRSPYHFSNFSLRVLQCMQRNRQCRGKTDKQANKQNLTTYRRIM